MHCCNCARIHAHIQVWACLHQCRKQHCNGADACIPLQEANRPCLCTSSPRHFGPHPPQPQKKAVLTFTSAQSVAMSSRHRTITTLAQWVQGLVRELDAACAALGNGCIRRLQRILFLR